MAHSGTIVPTFMEELRQRGLIKYNEQVTQISIWVKMHSNPKRCVAA